MPDDRLTTLDLARILRRRAPLIVFCVLVTGLAAFAISKAQQNQYRASAYVYFRNPDVDQLAAGFPTTQGIDAPSLLDTNLKLASLPGIAAATAAAIGHGATQASVSNGTTVSKSGNANVLTVTATSASPTRAALIANVYARQIIAYRQVASQNYYNIAMRSVQAQYGALSRSGRASGAGSELKNRLYSLSTLSQLEANDVQFAQSATVPSSPYTPRVTRNTALGAVLGLLLGLALAFLLERFDRRLREPGDLADVYDAPLIGVVPYSSDLKSPSKSVPTKVPAQAPPAVAETFALLWARIRYFNVDRELTTLLITSAQPDEGKTTIARNLALAGAKVGSRVLLIEGDLREPTLARQLGVQESPGISDVLLEGMPLDDAVQTVGVTQPGGRQLELDVLVAGGVLPPDPAHIIESHSMEILLDRARAAYDFLLIDAPPLAVISDAFPLLRQADGVVVIGRVGRSRSDTAARLRQTLARANAPIVGVIANAYRRRPGATYGYDRDFGAASGPRAGANSSIYDGARLAQSDGRDQVTRH